MKFMDYSLNTAFASLSSHGINKIVEMIKLALKEMPRLEAAFLNLKTQQDARFEIVWIMDQIQNQIEDLANKKTDQLIQLNESIFQHSNYTQDEVAMLERFSLLKEQFKEILTDRIQRKKKSKAVFDKV
jgi:hypothetical protein